MKSQSVSLEVDGSAMPTYVARPDDGVKRPAVIVLQEIFGVNTEVRRITDLVASAGYVGCAINYYHRTHPDLNEPYTPDGLQRGFAAAGQVSRATLRADVAAAVAWLQSQDFVDAGRIATWGFCFGGSVAFVTATLPGLAAAVAFYGGSIAAPFPNGEAAGISDAPDIRVPLLLVYGGKDAHIGPGEVEAAREALAAAGKTFAIKVYPEKDHAFFRNSSAVLATDPDVADAWNLVQAFLRDHLQ